MKTNIKSLLLALLVVPFLTYCATDEPTEGSATITFNDVTNNTTEIVDGQITVTGSVKSNEGTSIESISIVCQYGTDGQVNTTTIFSSLKDLVKIANNEYTFAITEASSGIKDHLTDATAIIVTAKVKNGDESSKKLEITIGSGHQDTELSEATTFTLGRPANATNPESAYGISYTSNTTATQAKFTAKNLALTKEEYDAITTQEELSEKAEGASFADSFTSESDANFKALYFIIEDGDSLRLISMTNLQFKEGNNVATFTERH